MAFDNPPNPSPPNQIDGAPPPSPPQASQPPQSSASTVAAASPPLPQRHTAVTPGPRAARFQEMYDLALKHTLTKISYENFAACYPTIARDAPHILRQVQRQMVDRLAELCNREFVAVLQGRGVVPKLNELEGLVSDAERRRREAGVDGDADDGDGDTGGAGKKKKRKTTANGRGDDGERTQVPPHLLPADDILRAHLTPHLVAQQNQMNAKLQNMQASNARLFEAIQAQRTEMEGLLAALEKIMADVDGANELMDVVVDEVARESVTIEAEMVDA